MGIDFWHKHDYDDMWKEHSIAAEAYWTDCPSYGVVFNWIEFVFLVEVFDKHIHSDSHECDDDILIHQGKCWKSIGSISIYENGQWNDENY